MSMLVRLKFNFFASQRASQPNKHASILKIFLQFAVCQSCLFSRQGRQKRERQAAKVRQKHSVFPGPTVHVEDLAQDADQPAHAYLQRHGEL